MMKSFPASPAIIVAVLFGLSSCGKIKSLVGGLGGKMSPPATAVPYSGPLVSEIPEGSYVTFPRQPGRVVIVDFYADWCGPCRQLSPILDQIATEHQGAVLVGRVNIDQFKKLAIQEGVQAIPDVRIFRDGKQVDKFVGTPAESEVRRRIESQLKGLPPIPQAAKPKTTGPVTAPMAKDWMPNGMRRR